MYAKVNYDLYEKGAARHEGLDPLIDTAHTLIAGTTGSGKSTLLNSVIWSIMSAPSMFLFIDLKRVELKRFENYQGCLDYVDDPGEIHRALTEIQMIMEDRYDLMQKEHKYSSDEVPIFVIIDELADCVSDKKVLQDLVRIGRLGRAANIHLICATQDPSRKTLSAQLMQNFTCCVALRCKTAIESRQITGFGGAESLPRYGQAYLWDPDGYRRIKVPVTSDEQIAARVSKLARWYEKTAPKRKSVFDW